MWKIILCVICFISGLCCAEKIIIIGAGAAGIAAASKLLDENITDFRILEAQNRIGGRIHSFHLGDAYVDLGAEYVHGETGNVVYELSKEYIKHTNLKDRTAVYYMGNPKAENDLLHEFSMIYDEIEIPENINISIGTAFLEKYSVILSKYKNNPKMYNYAKSIIRTMECLVMSLEGCYSWFSPTSYPMYKPAEGDQNLSWNGLGYKTIFDILLKKFSNKKGHNIDDQVSFNKTVSKIILNDSSVQVACDDGSKYVAEHVIFTPSLGVLKHDHRKIFEPGLADAKSKVINDLGFEGVMKIFFEFPEKWWGEEECFLFVWTEEERNKLNKDVPSGPTKYGEHWLSWFTDIVTAPNNPRVLTGWFLGPLVPEVEKLSQEEVKNGTMYVIRKFLGAHFNITEPTKVIHSKWVTNPNTRGTYSFDTMKSRTENEPDAREILQEPVNGKDGIPRILFAGEATSTNRSSTVDGAIGSGLREAERLVKILKK